MSRQYMNINIVSLTITHLKQIVDKLSKLKEEDLLKLDQMMTLYSNKRKAQFLFLSDNSNTFQEQISHDLELITKDNQYLMKELEIVRRNFEKEKLSISAGNLEIIKSMNSKYQQDIGNEKDSLEDLVRDLINQIAKYRNVTDYYQRWQQIIDHQHERSEIPHLFKEYYREFDKIFAQELESKSDQDQEDEPFFLEIASDQSFM